MRHAFFKNRKGWCTILTALILAMLLGGCNMFPQKQEVSDGKQKFSVYYTNADHTQLKSLSYEPQSETFEDILNELLKQFSTSVETEYVSVLPDNGIEAVSLENNHVMDHGEEGYEDTKDTLRNAGVVYSNSEEIGVSLRCLKPSKEQRRKELAWKNSQK